MQYRIEPGGTLSGSAVVPGDKSISHRAVMLSSIAEGISKIDGLLIGEDVLATIAAFRSMGVTIQGPVGHTLVIEGVGLHGLIAPDTELNMGNSGTAMRLLSGILVGQRFPAVLMGDESLTNRPMKRITEPLSTMGAVITPQVNGTPPITTQPANKLTAIRYTLPIASAQVKSALLLAGLYAQGETCVIEPEPTRDHTERMLAGMGYPVTWEPGSACVSGGGKLMADTISVPGDISSAAFYLVGATIAAGSDLLLKNIGVNPTRTGILNILQLMGATITLENLRQLTGEPVADIRVVANELSGIDIPLELIPLAIDEFPVICIAAACAGGMTRIRGAQELRHKESDRLATMATGLSALGVAVTEYPDGLDITGGTLTGGMINSQGDHRIAMAFAIAGLVASAEIRLKDCDNVATSFPDFDHLSASLGLRISRK